MMILFFTELQTLGSKMFPNEVIAAINDVEFVNHMFIKFYSSPFADKLK